jgi:sortase A
VVPTGAARTVESVTRRHAPCGPPIAGVLAVMLLVGCSGVDRGSSNSAARPRPASAVPSTASSEPGGSSPGEPGSRTESEAPKGVRNTSVQRSRAAREPRRSHLSIPAIGLESVPVVRYTGAPDDAEGTRIQNRGPTASPRGAGGGVGPGEVGNFIITGHRTSHSAPFRDLPALRNGDRVRVRSGRTLFVYRVTGTRRTSFRSETSRAEQSAAVPGRPHADPVRPMITLSTCATPEDHATGNYWSDRFGNPEHRIDKVGVLVAQVRAGA